MRAVCTMVILEIFVIQGIHYNQSPGDEVIGQLGKKICIYNQTRAHARY